MEQHPRVVRKEYTKVYKPILLPPLFYLRPCGRFLQRQLLLLTFTDSNTPLGLTDPSYKTAYQQQHPYIPMADMGKNSLSSNYGGSVVGLVTQNCGNCASRSKPRGPTIANPGTLGLFSFASTTFMLSLYNMNARGIHEPNVVVGMAIFCGGLAQLLAGMWEFPRGNMFAATAFTSYGAFWLSYASILLPGTGIIDAYVSAKALSDLSNALGIYLITWMMVTIILFIATLGKSVAFVLLFGLLASTFAVLAVGEFSGHTSATHAGGAIGLITAAVAYYIALSELLSGEAHPVFRLPLGAFH
jgi:succinate-acetate transporter protein